ncbi:hypothetical protein OG21DRAFT_1503085 [Imleria badia]|nr:hypothetical protein OG21DRAFT_1503085 [Imleria badia]
MNSPSNVPAGPEAAPTTQTSQPLMLAPQSSLSSTGLPPASTASIAVFLSLFGLAALAFAICWTRRRRTTSKVSDERPLEKATIRDVEALAANRRIVPITPLPDVRWTPQIRSISGPTSDKGSDNKALPPKRARSPPPPIKPRHLYPDPYAKSAPPHALSFSQHEIPRPAKSSRDLSPPVTPQALAVSGVQTRSLGRPGAGSEG